MLAVPPASCICRPAPCSNGATRRQSSTTISDWASVGANFGDGGTLFFGVLAADLEAGRFDRVQAISQSG
jgi:hypothetical protein